MNLYTTVSRKAAESGLCCPSAASEGLLDSSPTHNPQQGASSGRLLRPRFELQCFPADHLNQVCAAVQQSGHTQISVSSLRQKHWELGGEDRVTKVYLWRLLAQNATKTKSKRSEWSTEVWGDEGKAVRETNRRGSEREMKGCGEKRDAATADSWWQQLSSLWQRLIKEQSRDDPHWRLLHI